MKLSNKLYDILKWIAQLLIPSLGALYFAISGIWGFPYVEEVVGILCAVDAFLGAVLGISSNQYSKMTEETNEHDTI